MYGGVLRCLNIQRTLEAKEEVDVISAIIAHLRTYVRAISTKDHPKIMWTWCEKRSGRADALQQPWQVAKLLHRQAFFVFMNGNFFK